MKTIKNCKNFERSLEYVYSDDISDISQLKTSEFYPMFVKSVFEFSAFAIKSKTRRKRDGSMVNGNSQKVAEIMKINDVDLAELVDSIANKIIENAAKWYEKNKSLDNPVKSTYAYCYVVVDNFIADEYDKSKKMQRCVSLYEQISDDEYDELTMIDIIPNESSPDPQFELKKKKTLLMQKRG